jgi:hypothetical protein
MADQVVRGTPRYVDGAAAGAAGVVTLIPEAVSTAAGVRPVAVVAVLGEEVTRLAVAPGRDRRLRPLLGVAAVVPLLALWAARRARAHR